MADINLKTETPDTSLPTTGFLFGADSQAAASPSVYSTQTVATTLLGSTSLTGATVTADSPVLNLAQTWNNVAVTFTGLKFNVPTDSSASGSLLMDLQVGGSSQFKVGKTGGLTLSGPIASSGTIYATSGQIGIFSASNYQSALRTNGVAVTSTNLFGFSSDNSAVSAADTILTRRAAANLRLGAADTGATTATVTITIAAPGVVTWSSHGFSTGTPVVFTTTGALPTGITAGTTYYAVVVDANTFQIASSVANAIAATPTVITTSGTQSGTHTGTRYNITQRLSMQSVTGVTDRLGADLIITGSQGTGTGRGGDIIFQVAPAGSTGSAQNAFVTALAISGTSDTSTLATSQTKLAINIAGTRRLDYNVANSNNWTLSGGLEMTNNLQWFGKWALYGTSGTAQISVSNGYYAWDRGNPNFPDAYLYSPSAAIIQLGAIDAASPVPQTLRVQSATGTNSAGATWTRRGSLGTGTGAAGNIVEQTGFSGSSGTTAHTAVDREIIVAQGNALTDNTAKSLFEIALPTLAMAGGVIEATVICTDGTDMQVVSETITYAVVNKGGVYTKDVDVQTTSSALSAGTLTNTWAFLDGTNKVTMQLTSDTSLTATKFLVYYKVRNNSEQATTIL